MRTKPFDVIVPLLLALCWLNPAVAQESRPAAPSLHPLWKVQGKTNTVYLLGSIHILKEEDYPLAAPIDAAFSNSQVVVFETDMEAMEKPATVFRLMSKASLPAGETLKDQLSPEVYANFRKHVEDAGLFMIMLDRYKPAMAAMTLEIMEVQKLGVDPQFGVDKHYFDLARKEGKRIDWLETVDFQIGLITDFTKEEGELIIKTSLEEIDNTRKLYREMVSAWETGDSDRMQKLLNEAEQQAPVLYQRLLLDRNRNWIPKIEDFLRSGKNTIVIVGAGHLVGPEGVVELLKKKGLKVTQL